MTYLQYVCTIRWCYANLSQPTWYISSIWQSRFDRSLCSIFLIYFLILPMILLYFLAGFFSLHTTHPLSPQHFHVSWFSLFFYQHSCPLWSYTLMPLSTICMLITLQRIPQAKYFSYLGCPLGYLKHVSKFTCPNWNSDLPNQNLVYLVRFPPQLLRTPISLFSPEISETSSVFLFF